MHKYIILNKAYIPTVSFLTRDSERPSFFYFDYSNNSINSSDGPAGTIIYQPGQW